MVFVSAETKNSLWTEYFVVAGVSLVPTQAAAPLKYRNPFFLNQQMADVQRPCGYSHSCASQRLFDCI